MMTRSRYTDRNRKKKDVENMALDDWIQDSKGPNEYTEHQIVIYLYS